MPTATETNLETYKKEWDSFECIRTEFAGHFDRYAAFRAGEDSGSIVVSTESKPRLSILKLAEKTQLEWELTPSVRERFGSLDAYRSHCWSREFRSR